MSTGGEGKVGEAGRGQLVVARDEVLAAREEAGVVGPTMAAER